MTDASVRSSPLHLRVFLASPGDVAHERGLAAGVIDELRYEPLLRGRVTVELVAWDTPGGGVPMLASMTPQMAIAQGLPKPSECDIVVAIFWARMGTPLPPEYTKPDGSRYLSGTEWEYLDALHASERSGRPVVLVYRRKERVLLDPSDPRFNEKHEQWQRTEAFFAAMYNEDGSIRRGFNLYATWDEFRKNLSNHLKEIIRRLLEAQPDTPAAPAAPNEAPLWEGSPFPGLLSFTPDDAPIFFGRGREADGLIYKLSDPSVRFVAVVGASGSGKSSLVAAGLLPRLRAGAIEGSHAWVCLRFSPGELSDDPFIALMAQLARVGRHRGRQLAAAKLRDNPSLIADLAEEVLAGHPPEAKLLLFMDQLEEIFSLVNPAYLNPFIDLLVAATQSKRVLIVATLRADFYPRCVESPPLAELLREGSYPLAAPELGALLEMITKPAARAGLIFEEGLAERILEDTGTEPGSLALMAFALSELYEQRGPDGRLTHAAYERFNGVQGAIAKRAEDAFGALEPKTQAALGDVFRELVEVDEQERVTRRRAPVSRVASSPEAAELVEALTAARLLVKGLVQAAHGGEPVVEVAHEILLTSWPRLAEWIQGTRADLRLLRQVRLAAAEWEREGRQEEFLWPDKRLGRVYAMLDRLRPALNAVERRFVRRASREELLAELDDLNTAHSRRAVIGDYLAERGDTRPGVGVSKSGLPEIAWCDVPGGEVRLEGFEEKQLATVYDAEGDSGLTVIGNTYHVEPFQLAKYPITRAQYRAFVDAPDGYNRPEWWDGLGWRFERMEDEPPEPDNRPAVYVCWFEAVAFCRWLSVRLGEELRLPTEWEWQQAATHGDPTRVYPWGSDWDARRANTDENRLSHATAVGMYPAGATPSGILDMSGNVWEWCLNEYENAAWIALGGMRPRVVRGGSWSWNHEMARTTHRDRDLPDYRSRNHGFRVMRARRTP